MITKVDIDKGLLYFGIPTEYKDRCYRCFEIIWSNSEFSESLEKAYKFLNTADVNDLKKCWSDGEEGHLLCDGIDPFATNLVVVLGYKTCEKVAKEYGFDEQMETALKSRIRYIFEYDLTKFGAEGIRYTQMSWAYYLIRGRVVEVGRLQYENFDGKLVKIHIPGGKKLDKEGVLESLEDAKSVTEGMFGLKDAEFICESWLLSNQINALLDPDSNLVCFYNLFYVEDGRNCINDVLYQVFSVFKCEDYNNLPEDTTLRKKVKEQLLNNKEFKLGIGRLKTKKVM